MTASADGRTPVVRPDGRWRALTVLALSMVLAMTTWFSATAVLPELRAAWDLSTNQGSWLTISVQIGFVLGALASALFNVADLVPPRRLILIGSIGAALANLSLVWATGLAAAIPARILTGCFLAGVYPSALKAMATWFVVGRGTALGIMVGALTLGSAMPHLVNGLGGVEPDVVLVTTSVLTVLGGLVADRIGTDGPNPFPRAVFDPRFIGRIVRDRRVMLASAGYFGHMWELYAMWAWVAVFLRDRLEADGAASASTTASYLAFATIGVGAIGCWVGGVIGDRVGRAESTMLSMAVSGLCALVIGRLGGAPLWVTVAVAVVWGFWVVADSAQFSTVVTEVAEQSYVGTAVTLQLATGFTLTVFTVWLVPIVRDATGWAWAFTLLVPGPAVGIVAMYRLRALTRSG